MRLGSRREKVFGPGRAVPLDRNAKARIMAYSRTWSRLHCLPGQHKGPITRACLDVLQALLWGFHNSRTGICFPSYERIAEKAECSRTTVYEALKVLEWAGVLSWQHRIVRVRELCQDLWGRAGWRWRVIRTSNAYVFRDPQAVNSRPVPSGFGNRAGTQNQEVSGTILTPAIDPQSPLERALARFAAAVAAKKGIEQEGGG
jgi:Helix-turn-helix domain